MKKRKELELLIREKKASLDLSLSANINATREQERKKRLKLYGEVEQQRQEITASLVHQLMKICDEDDAPRYVSAITKVLENFQGLYISYFFYSLN